jgi:hypothetical protein
MSPSGNVGRVLSMSASSEWVAEAPLEEPGERRAKLAD